MKPWTVVVSALAILLLASPEGSAAPAATLDAFQWSIDAFGPKGAAATQPATGPASLDSALWPGTAAVPLSFVYDGKSSRDFLASWKQEVSRFADASSDRLTTQWTDPATGLRVTATTTAFKDFSAAEWVLSFENTGKSDSPILEKVNVLDTLLPAAAAQPIVLDQIRGDDATANTFMPMERELKSGESVALAAAGGRPSNGTFPFFAIENGPEHVFVAIGWTGQWASSLVRNEHGVAITAGMELTHLRLHPGESIRTPRILLQHARCDRYDAHNAFRRLLLAHYVPRYGGALPKFAIAAQTFDRWYLFHVRPEWPTEAGQIAAAKVEKEIGCDTHWFDAGWFEGEFPAGVGNWTVKPKEFPRGLGPVGKACDDLGLKFLLWYEPERVAANTRIAKEHPEFVLSAGQPKIAGGLFNLGDPAARRWLTDLLLRQIDEFHIDTYRNDFNMDPLGFWRAADAPDRQGMTEIRYVEGFYQWWDELQQKHPDMVMDDCASGGRRIDLEMVKRSVVQSRSDSSIAPDRSTWNQTQTYGLSLFLPLHATIGWEMDVYSARSAGAAGVCFDWDMLDPQFPVELARADLAETKSLQKFWSGDYYPLTACTLDPSQWIAWQLNRSDLREGFVAAFRREGSQYSAFQPRLHAIQPDATYRIEISDADRHVETKTITGKELSALELHLAQPRSSVILHYTEVSPKP